MKKFFLFYVGLVILLVLIPVISVLLTGGIYKDYSKIKVYIVSEDVVEEMDTSQYLKEVVAAEMPADFELEALKAQAVAARTYLRKRINNMNENGADKEHKGAVVCTDYRHCAAWMSEKDRKSAWEKDKAKNNWEKISVAVDSTKNEILTFDGKPISAVFHSTSSGNTEASSDVWGGEVPYLISVESKGDELSPKFYAEKLISKEEFMNIVSYKYKDADITAPLFENIVKSPSGGIVSLKTCGITMKGTEFRVLFDLRSTNIEFIEEETNILMKTKGYGHGVGMSQYGANYMASQGKTYREILAHFYQGTTLDE